MPVAVGVFFDMAMPVAFVGAVFTNVKVALALIPAGTIAAGLRGFRGQRRGRGPGH